jgi:hypothetical protein
MRRLNLATAAPYSTIVGESRQRYCAIAFPSSRRHRVITRRLVLNNSLPLAKKLSMRQAAELAAVVALERPLVILPALAAA